MAEDLRIGDKRLRLLVKSIVDGTINGNYSRQQLEAMGHYQGQDLCIGFDSAGQPAVRLRNFKQEH